MLENREGERERERERERGACFIREHSLLDTSLLLSTNSSLSLSLSRSLARSLALPRRYSFHVDRVQLALITGALGTLAFAFELGYLSHDSIIKYFAGECKIYTCWIGTHMLKFVCPMLFIEPHAHSATAATVCVLQWVGMALLQQAVIVLSLAFLAPPSARRTLSWGAIKTCFGDILFHESKEV